jgi:ubiquinone/menaquinone biosynthesis C-methylase UbiE
MQRLAPWEGRDLLDIGCGTGFHLPVFAAHARSVVGVEPHGDLAAIARRRVRRLPNATVLHGSAEALPLDDDSVDVMHARWAYFFGPGCEPGLAELDRVMRPASRAFVIDNDPSRSTFGEWFRLGYPQVDHVETAAFWDSRGWERHPVEMAWTFDSREDLESVVRIEFAHDVAEEILAGHEGTSVDYAVNVWTRTW